MFLFICFVIAFYILLILMAFYKPCKKQCDCEGKNSQVTIVIINRG